MKITKRKILIAIPLALLLAIGIYSLPPVHSRLAWRVDNLRTQIKYALNPPDEAVFQPQEQSLLATIVAQTMQAYSSPAAPTATSTPLPAAKFIPPSPTTTPLPSAVELEVKYENQHGHLNYCAPANFSMALTYWGWNGSREVIGPVVKPSDKDKNVMPYELQDYIAQYVPGMTSIIRYGGDIDLLKRMVAAGYPVVVEKGIYEVDLTGTFSWLGHYAFVTGYDEPTGELIYQDSYQPDGAPRGNNRHIKYDEFVQGWRAFDFLFVVVYPVDHESTVLSLLGDYADEAWAARHALEVAQAEGQALSGADQYFAWFNQGTSHTALFEYPDASIAYDYAFQLYADLGGEKSLRPYRMLWYQTGPYKAYFYSGRYTDVINLANTTLHDTISEPVLEESLYWHGQAEYMIGDTNAAITDYRNALKVHPNWQPAIQALQDLGVAP